MRAETRTKNLMYLLGWKGGTIHDACKEIGCDVQEFLYQDADFDGNGTPCSAFIKGCIEAEDTAIYMHKHKGDLQYWFGAITAVQKGLVG